MTRTISIVLPEFRHLSGVPRGSVEVVVCPEAIEMEWTDDDDPTSGRTWALEWICGEGDDVKEGQPIAALIGFGRTMAIDITSSIDGVLTQIVAKEGRARPGDVLALVSVKRSSKRSSVTFRLR